MWKHSVLWQEDWDSSVLYSVLCWGGWPNRNHFHFYHWRKSKFCTNGLLRCRPAKGLRLGPSRLHVCSQWQGRKMDSLSITLPLLPRSFSVGWGEWLRGGAGGSFPLSSFRVLCMTKIGALRKLGGLTSSWFILLLLLLGPILVDVVWVVVLLQGGSIYSGLGAGPGGLII